MYDDAAVIYRHHLKRTFDCYIVVALIVISFFTHLAAQGEQRGQHLGEVFAFPQIDGLENVHVGDSVRFDCLLEAVNAKTTQRLNIVWFRETDSAREAPVDEKLRLHAINGYRFVSSTSVPNVHFSFHVVNTYNTLCIRVIITHRSRARI